MALIIRFEVNAAWIVIGGCLLGLLYRGAFG
jgi:hypothetical protein